MPGPVVQWRGRRPLKPEIRVRIPAESLRGVGQPGSPPALGAGGRWFESSHSDFEVPRFVECSSVWQSAWFGTRRPRVRLLSRQHYFASLFQAFLNWLRGLVFFWINAWRQGCDKTSTN